MRLPSRQQWIRFGIAAAAALVIAILVRTFLVHDRSLDTFMWRGREVTILEPRWFYLLALVPYVFLVVGETLSDLSFAQLVLSCVWRSSLVAGLALALARPSIVSENTKVATVILCDVSPSITDKQLAAAQKYVDDAFRARKGDDQLFVVSFAERPRTLTSATPGKAPLLTRHEGELAGTDIQAALQLAYGLYPPGYLPRAVVVSDGNQTSGDVLAEAYKAHEFGVKVSWQVFDADRAKEIRVVALHLPDEVKVGAPFEIVGEVWSTHDEQVTLNLRQDDFPNGLEPSKTVQLHEGVNRIPFKTEAKAAGFTTYKLTLRQPKEDTEKANNETVATAPVQGRPRVLYVEGEYERQPQVASYLQKALERENIDVEVRGARGVPSSAQELERYDLVLLSDVAQMFLGLAQMQAIESYVRDGGGGFIMAGGEDSFGSGGYQGTRIEKILPVRFDGEKEKSQPSLAIVLVIDRSGSMSGAKIEMAKESARATAEVLEPDDLISVVAFDNQPYTVVRLQRASNRLRISTDIARLQPGGGTNILPALQEAYQVLAPVNAKVKHVILLSDGQAGYEGIAEVCREMRANRITVSAVGIGDADRNLLQLVAENGEGRFYLAEDASELPKIFVKETQEVQKSQLVEDVVKAIVAKKLEIIEGTGVEDAPYLHGYVSTKPKPMSEVILVSDERGEPLLARWRVGLGQVVAWTSDVKNRWASEWLAWPGYQKFWAQVIRSTMRHKQFESYDLAATVVAGKAHVVVDAVSRDDRFVNDLETTLQVVDPRDSKVKRELPMEQTAAGRYEADFTVDRYGTYILKAVHKRDGQVVAESTGAVALPYPAEYLKSTPNLEPLKQAALITGGAAQPKAADVYARAGESIQFHKDLWPYILMIVAMLFVVDVFLRRVRLFGYRAVKF
jgi:Ca-activated chloride channel family protein